MATSEKAAKFREEQHGNTLQSGINSMFRDAQHKLYMNHNVCSLAAALKRKSIGMAGCRMSKIDDYQTRGILCTFIMFQIMP